MVMVIWLMATVALAGESARTPRCEVAGAESPSASVDSLVARDLVASADAIVVARADSAVQTGGITLRVLDVLRAPARSSSRIGASITVSGTSSPADDFNPGRVPYATVRRDGLRGSCFARTYKPGATYLLLLAIADGVLTPYWAPLMPTNEQLRGADDPWLAWVRAHAASGRKGT